ncbi:DUF1990 domain-containing protein [Streptomyces ficellus]|uniref:DUF1990 domain-containing protein n=1 Tax=Streptomyces ficellus TaxID=1977088 RepID=A0ABT7Z5Z1_9ACTN|nr:DUF1990 domain-containing protein [Streptomyces ficellus]MDN3294878.1 DUF1990 domain-containing protein [Streptomyces ficellus]
MTRLIRSLSTTPAPPAFNYPDVGATRTRPLPTGYHHLHHEALIGSGREVFERAGAAVTTWRMHRAASARMRTGSARAEPGTAVYVSLGAGPLRITAPCEVVWTAYEERRTGFAYGTREGHPESGEESFVVELRADGSVWFTVTAFSRPGRWYTQAAGPLARALQHGYARHLGRTLRKIADR